MHLARVYMRRPPYLRLQPGWTRFEGPRLRGVLDKGKEGTDRVREITNGQVDAAI
jgi:hypothetical protein